MFPHIERCIGTILLVALLLDGCTPAVTQAPTPTIEPSPVLTLYHTPTVTPSPSGLPPTRTPLPSPTLTPVTYAVRADDDLFGISLRFGVSLPALKTANPKVNPYFMGVGTLLTIPVTPPASGTGTLTAATPRSANAPRDVASSVSISLPTCYPSADGGLWCLALAHNQQTQSLENLSVIFRLAGKNPDVLTDQAVFSPFNVLPGSGLMPVVIYFPAPAPSEYGVEVQVDSALPVAPNDVRYLAAKIQQEQIQVDGLAARATGQVALADATAQAGEIWVLAVAYGEGQQVVGLRKWESPTGLAGGESLPFDLTVYSLGPDIQRVELLVEAHK
ncbi:MAG: LysM domain-containing protein [Anaerolineaceae bacterium]|nr:LysM domain-containing protein [Anaerolineaceae bacterium]